jgi:choline monooxygenase
MSKPTSLNELLGNLKDLSEKPLNQATGLPKAVYTSEEFLRLEEQEIFYKQWVCVGRADSISEAGDYLTHHLAYQPVTVMRQKSGEITAFSNVCLHRMMRLLEGSGSCDKIICPYHGWAYDIQGNLIGAPHMHENPNFRTKDFVLPRVRCEIWEGWIYVTLDQDIDPVSVELKKLYDIVHQYKMSDYVNVVTQDYVWTGNWKQLVENFIEGYHLPVTHSSTVGEHLSVNETRFSENPPDPAFTYQTFTKSYGARIGRAHDDNLHLTGEQRKTSFLIGVFPNHFYILAPDHLWYISIQPKGTGEIYIRYGAAIAPEVLQASSDKQGLINEVSDILDQVNDEDKRIIEGLYKGVHSPLSDPGPLCWLEQQNHEFIQYLARNLCGKML